PQDGAGHGVQDEYAPSHRVGCRRLRILVRVVARAEDQYRVGRALHDGDLRRRPGLPEFGEAGVRTAVLPHELRVRRVAHVDRINQAATAPRRQVQEHLAGGEVLVHAGDAIEEVVLVQRRRRDARGSREVLDHRSVVVQPQQLRIELLGDESPQLLPWREAADFGGRGTRLIAVDRVEGAVARAVEHDDADRAAVVHDGWPRVNHVAMHGRADVDGRAGAGLVAEVVLAADL